VDLAGAQVSLASPTYHRPRQAITASTKRMAFASPPPHGDR